MNLFLFSELSVVLSITVSDQFRIPEHLLRSRIQTVEDEWLKRELSVRGDDYTDTTSYVSEAEVSTDSMYINYESFINDTVNISTGTISSRFSRNSEANAS